MVELLLVLLIIGMMGMMGSPVHKNIDKMQLLMTAEQIQSLIREAQDRAYGEMGTHIVAFDYGRSECTHIQNARTIKKIEIPSKLYMQKTNFDNGRLYFRGGLAPSKGGTIMLNSKKHHVKITVLPVTGRVRVYPVVRK